MFGRLSKLPRSLVFKADLCQQADPHTVWSSSVLISTQLIGLVGAKQLGLCMCESLLVLMQLSPLCLRKVVSYSPLFTAQWPYRALPLCFSCRLSTLGGKLDLWLGVTHCGSCDATGLVATSAQWHWHCCSPVACTRAPELPWLVQLSPQCHPRYCWH